MSHRVSIIVAALAALAALAAPPADACGNVVVLEQRRGAAELAWFEAKLERGEVERLRGHFVHIVFADNAQKRRSMTLDRAALMRRGWRPDRISKQLLEELRAAPDDSQVKAWVAESMVRRAGPRRRLDTLFDAGDVASGTLTAALARWEAAALRAYLLASALELLEDLQERDLMPDAYAFATLATVYHRVGNPPARDRAFDRCRLRTEVPALCQLL